MKQNSYPIHSDFKPFEKFRVPLSPAILPAVNAFLAAATGLTKPRGGLRVAKRAIAGYRGGTVTLEVIEPEGIGAGAPCLIYFHGGAFALKASPYHKRLAFQYAAGTPCKTVTVDYRLAPKHPFPTALEDCYAAFEWVCCNADELGIDPDRIAVGGDSAGGALAAAVCLMARDRNARGIRFQMLIYPVTDARQTTDSMMRYADTPVWNATLNGRMWKQYLPDGAGVNREYASPLEAASFERLPDAYVEVAEYDCLRDEGVLFAQELQSGGSRVELVETKGAVHGYDIAEKSEIVRQTVAKRIGALQSALQAVD